MIMEKVLIMSADFSDDVAVVDSDSVAVDAIVVAAVNAIMERVLMMSADFSDDVTLLVCDNIGGGDVYGDDVTVDGDNAAINNSDAATVRFQNVYAHLNKNYHRQYYFLWQ